MTCYDPGQLGLLLRNWGSGNLNNIIDRGHALVGVRDVVMTGAGMTATGLCQRYTMADIDNALTLMLEGEHRHYAIILICKYLMNWTMERLARALGQGVSSVYTLVMIGEDIFAGVLLDHAY